MKKLSIKSIAIITTLVLIAALFLTLILILNSNSSNARVFSLNPLPTWEVSNPVSTVFVMDNIPPTAGSLAAGDSTVPDAYLDDPAIDTLLLMMEAKNIYFYKTSSHPDGIVGSDNIVILKGNFQWTNRNTTSTDRIKGVIRKILNHPDGFTGEILICDNTQDFGTGINHDDDNSEDPEQSIIDVRNTFYSKGYEIYTRDWADMWDDVALEYNQGDLNDGFVYEPSSKITYPKFQSPSGNYYISLRYGIWNQSTQQYDPDKLCIIDFAVLKAHSMAGSTIAVKNWIGVLTTAYASQRYGGWNALHYQYLFGPYALVAKVMSVTFPKLSIVDAAWTSASGPSNLEDTVHTRMLLASTDPCAVSWYSAKFILTPVAVDPFNTDPDRPGSNYKYNLDAWTNLLRDSSFACTNDSSEMSVYDREILSVTSSESNIEGTNPDNYTLFQNYPNPFNSQTVISFKLNDAATIQLEIFDSNGKLVRTLVDGESYEAGKHHISWDGKGISGQPSSSGVYFYRISSGSSSKTLAMILKK